VPLPVAHVAPFARLGDKDRPQPVRHAENPTELLVTQNVLTQLGTRKTFEGSGQNFGIRGC
jgi:hypothetical protein